MSGVHSAGLVLMLVVVVDNVTRGRNERRKIRKMEGRKEIRKECNEEGR